MTEYLIVAAVAIAVWRYAFTPGQGLRRARHAPGDAVWLFLPYTGGGEKATIIDVTSLGYLVAREARYLGPMRVSFWRAWKQLTARIEE